MRETWALEDCGEDGQRVVWAADRAAAYVLPGNQLGEVFYLPSDYDPRPWRPSIHMPRWASRISLEVVSVRVERLHDISEADARAEGAEPRRPAGAAVCLPGPVHLSHVVGFRELWCSISGPDSWDANPWLWVVEFKKAEG